MKWGRERRGDEGGRPREIKCEMERLETLYHTDREREKKKLNGEKVDGRGNKNVWYIAQRDRERALSIIKQTIIEGGYTQVAIKNKKLT